MAADRLWESHDLTIAVCAFNGAIGDSGIIIIIHNKNAIAATNRGDGLGAIWFSLPESGFCDSRKRFLAQIFFNSGKYSLQFGNFTFQYRRTGVGRHGAACAFTDGEIASEIRRAEIVCGFEANGFRIDGELDGTRVRHE
jgi:hypothetical protein